jgi:membrane carboxypeptidase/penicillin-binding protein
MAPPPKIVALERQRRDTGFHFVDFLGREAKADGIESLTAQPYTIHSTINATLQRDAEAALQEGLAHYEIEAGRVQFHGPEANIGDAVQKLSGGHSGTPSATADAAPGTTPAWQQALANVHLPLYDVHWEPAVILKSGKRGEEALRVGLADGRVLPLSTPGLATRRNLNQYDVVYVRVTGGGGEASDGRTRARSGTSAHAQLRVRPTVQGATLVLENKTGRILAMAGSFSYPLSQLNRTSQTQRQPGSAIKPVTYLTALQKGLQPNTLIPDEPLTLPPIGSRFGAYDTGIISRPVTNARDEDYWTPRNYGYTSGGIYTMRRGLENSVNIVTAHLLDGGIEAEPERSLDDICATAVAAKIYADCVRYYPFVLGAQPVRMIDLAAFYAAIANEGARPQPHAIDSIEAGGHTVYRYPDGPPPTIGAAADHTSFYQLKTMLQGVVARGTARAIGHLSPYVAGKTGTTEDSVDGWFIGFTNDVTIAVWVGYDNGDGKRRSLGSTETGARLALPIFEPIINAVWSQNIAPKAPLSGPTPEAQAHLIDLPIDYASGQRVTRGSFVEHFRLGEDGRFDETQYQLVSRGGYASRQDSDGVDTGDSWGWHGHGWGGGRAYYQGWQGAPTRRLFTPWLDNRPRGGRDFFWGGR